MAKRKATVKITDTDKGWTKIVGEMGKCKRLFVQVGLQAGDKYPETGEDIATIAAQNEFGTAIIPSRPFMRQTFSNRQGELRKHVDAEYDAVIKQKKTTEIALKALGAWYQTQIQNEIVHGDFVPNAQMTIDNKGSDRPLIDTGRMRQSIRYVVRSK